MSKKYELTYNKKIGLTQIRALRDIERFGIKKGDLGGWVLSESNLSQEGDAWVYGNARVDGNAWVYGNARILGDAWVYGNARVFGNAWVFGNARVDGNARVFGNARVDGNARVFGNARILGDAWVYGNARVDGNARVFGNARVDGNARVANLADLLQISPIANDYFITLHRTQDGHQINIGCWSGSVDELLPKVRERRLSDQKVAEYELLVPFLQKRIESWKPVKTEKELEIEALEKRLVELKESK